MSARVTSTEMIRINPGPLKGLRIVEFDGEIAGYAGKLLADLGAEVILLEPPEGCSARHKPPFTRATDGGRLAIAHLWLNANKLSVDVAPGSAEETAGLKQLLETADVVLCSEPEVGPGAYGIKLEELCASYPRLIVAAMTPYGLTGPYRDLAADDLTVLAMGGLLSLAGNPGEAPTAAYGRQPYIAASLFGAVAVLTAVIERLASGQGQLIDVSAQQCVAQALETAAQTYDLSGVVRTRSGSQQRDAGLGLFPCKDGLVFLVISIAGGDASAWHSLANWMQDVPGAETFLEDRWKHQDYRATPQAREKFMRLFSLFAADKTKQELYETGQAQGLSIAPVATAQDVANNEQLRQRQFFAPLKCNQLGRIVEYPGAPYRLEKTPWSLRREAPIVGEHREWVYSSLSHYREAHSQPAQPGLLRRSSDQSLPLAGIRVADLTWVGAGPFASKALADHGAEVIKVESSVRPDATRLSGPFSGQPGLNRSGYFANRNTSKKSINVDLKQAEGRDIARRLIAKSDVVFNNFRPGVMKRFGLSYLEVRKIRPDIIYVDMPAFGCAGPARDYSAFGASISAVCGLHNLSGHANSLPVGTGTHYPDHIINPLHAASAILAALYHRAMTGEGQYIEVAQFESSVNGVGGAVLNYQITGDIEARNSNRDECNAPRCVVRCAGFDRWIAVSVRSEDNWRALCQVLDTPSWLRDTRFSSVASRLANQSELEKAIERRTRARDAYTLLERLQAVGVPSGVVQDARDVIDVDPALRERHWKYLQHPQMGVCLYDGCPFTLSRTPGGLQAPAPMIGQHTREILLNLLGYSEEQIAALQGRVLL